MKKMNKPYIVGLVLCAVVAVAMAVSPALARTVETWGQDVFRVATAYVTTATITSLTVSTTLSMPDSSVTTAKVGAQAVTTSKLFLDLPTERAACITSSKRLGTCSIAVQANGGCTCN